MGETACGGQVVVYQAWSNLSIDLINNRTPVA